MNVKKTIVIILIIAAIFFAGYFAGSFNSNREIAKLETRADNLKSQLGRETIRAGEIAKELGIANDTVAKSRERIAELESTNQRLEERNRIIADENIRITESIGNIGTGITEDKNRISGLIGDMDHYIKQGI